jgi:hypothetical protein
LKCLAITSAEKNREEKTACMPLGETPEITDHPDTDGKTMTKPF